MWNRIISKRVCALLFLVSIGCMVAYRMIGQTVDSEGYLVEPFGLIPAGELALVLGVIVGFLCIVRACIDAGS